MIVSLSLPMTYAKDQTFSFDNNHDGKFDNIFVLKDGEIVSQTRDLNFDGINDVFIKKEKTQRIETYQYKNQKYTKTIINEPHGTRLEINQNDKLSKYWIPALMAKNSCEYEDKVASIQSLEDLIKDIRKITFKKNEDYTYLNIGIRIHKSCLEKFNNFFNSDRFEELVEETLQTGLKCLEKQSLQYLDSDKPAEIFNTLNKVSVLLKNTDRPVSIHCGVENIKNVLSWRDNVSAMGTTNSFKFEGHDLEHPAVIFNPKLEVVGVAAYQLGTHSYDALEVKKTIFHELMHNAGYSHGVGFEPGYACEDCCYGSGSKLSCKLCAGNYNTTNDPDYLLDLAKYSSKNRNISFTSFYLKNYFNEISGENNDLALSYFFQSDDPLVAVPLSERILKERNLTFDNDLKNTYESNKKYALKYNDAQRSIGEKISNIKYDFYFNKNPSAFLEIEKILEQYPIQSAVKYNKTSFNSPARPGILRYMFVNIYSELDEFLENPNIDKDLTEKLKSLKLRLELMLY